MGKNIIFSLKPCKKSNYGIIKCVGYVEKGQKFSDEPMICNNETENEKDKYHYILEDNIYVRFNKCNMIDNYLMKTETLPVLFAAITYENNFVKNILLNIFIRFKINDIKKILTEKHLINKKIEGKYYVSIMVDDKIKSNTELDKFITNEEMIKTIIEMLKTQEMKNLIYDMMRQRKEERRKELGSSDEFTEIPKINYKFKDLVKKYKKTGEINL